MGSCIDTYRHYSVSSRKDVCHMSLQSRTKKCLEFCNFLQEAHPKNLALPGQCCLVVESKNVPTTLQHCFLIFLGGGVGRGRGKYRE